MKRIGCFFGTFDPVHVGHLIIAQHMQQYAGLDEVWIIVSPQNPFKNDNELTDDAMRFAMVNEVLKDVTGIHASDIELGLPKPSYTSTTLRVLAERHPNVHFDLIMGSDNLAGFHHWKDSTSIMENHRVLVYPRPGIDDHIRQARYQGHPSVNLVNAPLLDISATRIREMAAAGEEIRFLVADKVREMVLKQALYK